MRDETLVLLDEFATAWARGETPDPRQLLARAPAEERDELARALDRYLAAAPPRAASEASRAYVAALRDRLEAEEPPLLVARVARGLKRGDLVRALAKALGLEGREEKLALRYHELEAGGLDASRVHESVWSALAAILGQSVIPLARAWRPPPAATAIATAYYRVDVQRVAAEPQAVASAPPPSADEVDRLFGVG